MKYTNKQWQELANKVALFKQLETDIDNAKEDIRQMTSQEIINDYIDIKRSNNTTTTYPQTYKLELKAITDKLKEKYKNNINTITKENYTITLTPLKRAETQAETIATSIIAISNTKLKKFAEITK